MLVNGLRAHMAEFGIIVPQGIQRLPELVALLEDEKTGIPQIAREVLAAVQIGNLTTSIRQMEKRIVAWCRATRSNRQYLRRSAISHHASPQLPVSLEWLVTLR
jgi:transposase